jgi:hypothetical protein
MIAWKFKAWRTAGAALALTALAACGGEGGAGGEAGGEAGDAGGEAGEAAMSAPASTVVAPPGGGEAGEAGVTSAYAGLSGEQLRVLRVQHLKGFVMAASRILDDESGFRGSSEQAAMLVQQGLLEAYEPAAAEFGSLDVTPLREAAAGASLSRAEMVQRLRACQAALDAATASPDVNAAEIVARMVDISTGIYQHVLADGYVDPIEYQHSMGAALAARAMLVQHQNELRRRDMGAYSRSLAELTRLAALWPSREPPAEPATYQQVLVQGSRVRLALSPYL